MFVTRWCACILSNESQQQRCPLGLLFDVPIFLYFSNGSGGRTSCVCTVLVGLHGVRLHRQLIDCGGDWVILIVYCFVLAF